MQVGRYKADIVCKDSEDDESRVVIENQLTHSDHDHLGKALTYAAGLSATTIVWIAPKFRDEHRTVIDQLNEWTDGRISCFAVEIELWKIGESANAPKFNVVAKPPGWAPSEQNISIH